jgi:putative transcriptional regulator
MIKLKLDEVLREKNLTAYALHKASGLHQSVISKIKNNLSKALQLDVLDTLCAALECQPADLIVYESEIATQSVKPTQNVDATRIVDATQSASDSGFLTFNDVVRRLGKSDSSVRRYLQSNRLKGEQVKGQWQILPIDLIEFENSDFYRNLT